MFARKGVPGVTWQDELQKLDNELASGRISADDYRRRRDEILSGSAGGAPAQSPQQAPFAPPFKWEAKPPSASNSDATQVVPNQMPPQQQPQQNHNPDATQVVNTQNRSADAERTQFVAPVAPQHGGWGQPQQQQAAPPPWVSGDYDQINQPSPSWSHGPEVFDESGGGGKGRIFAIVGVVLVLALIGGGIWWFTSGSKSSGTDTPVANSETNPPTTSTSARPKLPGSTLPGKIDEANSGQTTVDQASKERSQFGPEEAALITMCGAEAGMTQVTYSDDWVTQIHAFKCSDEAAAKAAAGAVMEHQKKWGFVATTGPEGLPAMVNEKAIDVPDVPFDERLAYASKDTIVRIEVRGKTKEAMEGGMTKVVSAVAKNYPTK